MAPTQVETLPRSRNVIPDRVRIIYDWRVLPGGTPERVVELLRAALAPLPIPEGFAIEVSLSTEAQRTYTGLERVRSMFTPGFLMAADHPVVTAAQRIITERTQATPQLRPWAFATDGGHACGVHGIPCIGYAPGEERYAHTNRERLELGQAEEVYDTYPHLLRAVQMALL